VTSTGRTRESSLTTVLDNGINMREIFAAFDAGAWSSLAIRNARYHVALS
jgi:hypothetical protein